MERTIVTITMTRGLKKDILPYVTAKWLLPIFLTFSTQYSAEARTIKVVKEVAARVELTNRAEKDVTVKATIESSRVVRVIFSEEDWTYLVPVKINGDELRGCYLFSYDKMKNLQQMILISENEELEKCEVIKEIYACNREKGETSGVGVIYAKRIGADNYWFEGTFLKIGASGRLSVDTVTSNALTDISTVARAQKLLKCLPVRHLTP